MEVGGCFSEFRKFSQNSRGPLNIMIFLMFVWGWGALAKVKGGAKRKV